MSISKQAFAFHCGDTFRTNYIIAALLKWFMDIRMLLCGIATTFYNGISRTPGDVSLPAEWKLNVIQYLRNHYPPTEGIWHPRHLGLSWQMRWRQLFSLRPRAQPNQSKCLQYAYVWRADRGGQLNDTLNQDTLAMRNSLRSRVKGRNWHVDIRKSPHFTE